jgi:hypothetical protein
LYAARSGHIEQLATATQTSRKPVCIKKSGLIQAAILMG